MTIKTKQQQYQRFSHNEMETERKTYVLVDVGSTYEHARTHSCAW